MYDLLQSLDLKGKRVLVVGCGFGDDALRLARMGAEVSAFDLSDDSLAIATRLAEREGLSIGFDQMPAEALRYPPALFDCVIARDILHHVDIPQTMAELARVAKPGAVFVVNEIYSHSLTDRIRNSALVRNVLYPRMQDFIYGRGQAYITEDERKLSEKDVAIVARPLDAMECRRHFNFLVTRLIPDRYEWFARIDRALLALLRPFAPFLAGRILFCARFKATR